MFEEAKRKGRKGKAEGSMIYFLSSLSPPWHDMTTCLICSAPTTNQPTNQPTALLRLLASLGTFLLDLSLAPSSIPSLKWITSLALSIHMHHSVEVSVRETMCK
mmetsp:Transcript_4716/g.7336  ORF Transcript_4716/g.7336 Transcript_4716/m.7336 type:complete len:104 (+) Transcript_4716:949-1260(+)